MFNDWMESLAELLNSSIEAFAFAAWSFIEDAFGAGSLTGGEGSWWIAVVGGEITTVSDGEVVGTVTHPGMLNVVVMAMIPVLMIFVVLQVILSAIRGSTAGMIRAFAMGIFSPMLVYVVAGLIFTLIHAMDLLTAGILDAGSETDEGVVAVLHLFGLSWDETGENTSDGEAGVVLDENYVQWEMATIADDPGRALFPWLVALGMLICGFLLMLMMVLRLVIILVLAVFTPVPIFALTWEGSKSILARWGSVLAALLIAKPAAAVIVRMAAVMTTAASDWFQMVVGFVLLIFAAAAPLFMLGLISFMTGGASDAIERTAMASAAGGQRSVTRQGKALAGRAGRAGSKAMRGAGRAMGVGGPRGAHGGSGGGSGRSSGGGGGSDAGPVGPQPVKAMGNTASRTGVREHGIAGPQSATTAGQGTRPAVARGGQRTTAGDQSTGSDTGGTSTGGSGSSAQRGRGGQTGSSGQGDVGAKQRAQQGSGQRGTGQGPKPTSAPQTRSAGGGAADRRSTSPAKAQMNSQRAGGPRPASATQGGTTAGPSGGSGESQAADRKSKARAKSQRPTRGRGPGRADGKGNTV